MYYVSHAPRTHTDWRRTQDRGIAIPCAIRKTRAFLGITELAGTRPHVAGAVGGKRGERGKETALDEGVDEGVGVADRMEDGLDEVACVGVDAPAVADDKVPRCEGGAERRLVDEEAVVVADLVVAECVGARCGGWVLSCVG